MVERLRMGGVAAIGAALPFACRLPPAAHAPATPGQQADLPATSSPPPPPPLPPHSSSPVPFRRECALRHAHQPRRPRPHPRRLLQRHCRGGGQRRRGPGAGRRHRRQRARARGALRHPGVPPHARQGAAGGARVGGWAGGGAARGDSGTAAVRERAAQVGSQHGPRPSGPVSAAHPHACACACACPNTRSRPRRRARCRWLPALTPLAGSLGTRRYCGVRAVYCWIPPAGGPCSCAACWWRQMRLAWLSRPPRKRCMMLWQLTSTRRARCRLGLAACCLLSGCTRHAS